MTLTLVPRPRTCTAWCARHDYDTDVCSTDVVELDFTPDIAGVIDDANVALAASDDGTSIHVGMAGTGYGLTIAAAERLANAILGKVAAARGAR